MADPKKCPRCRCPIKREVKMKVSLIFGPGGLGHETHEEWTICYTCAVNFRRVYDAWMGPFDWVCEKAKS